MSHDAEPTSDEPRRGRGRPFRFADDPSPVGATAGGVDVRLGWALATSRVYRLPRPDSVRPAFAQLLRAEGVLCDQARLSRWESGAVAAPASVVDAYERVTGLPTGWLSGLSHALRPVEVAPLRVPETADVVGRLDALLEATDPATPAGGTVADALRLNGPRWLELATLLARHPAFYLPRTYWRSLADRLLTDLGRATGSAHLHRYEALRALMLLPPGRSAVLDAIEAATGDPGHPATTALAAPATLLQETHAPRAHELALRLLGAGGGPDHDLGGATWAIAVKLVRGHLGSEGVRRVDAALSVLLAAETEPGADQGTDLVDVVARLPTALSLRTLDTLAARDDPRSLRLRQVLRSGETHARDTVLATVGPLVAETQAALPAGRLVRDDEMLFRLVREALFHGHRQRRREAALLLATSAYRPELADRLLPLASSDGDDPDLVAIPAAQLLQHLAGVEQVDGLLDLARRPDRPAPVRRAALLALGSAGTPAHAPAVAALVSDPDRLTRRAAVRATGMTDPSALDTALGALAPAEAGALGPQARWWRRHGPALR